MSYLNTHTYDGKLNNDILPSLSLVDKESKLNELLDAARLTFDPISIKFLQSIISDTGKSSNVDITNGLVADDLLALCWYYKSNEDFMIILNEQLRDMSTGFCPQGRTHRIFQTLVAFNNI